MPGSRMTDAEGMTVGWIDWCDEFSVSMADGTVLHFEYDDRFGPTFLDGPNGKFVEPTEAQWEAFGRWFEERKDAKAAEKGEVNP